MRAACQRTIVSIAGVGGALAAMMAPANAATAGSVGVPATGPTATTVATHGVDTRSFHRGSLLGAVLTGAAEVPGPGDDDGRGLFVGKVKGDLLCYVLTASRIEEPMAAHIHAAPRDEAGGIVVGLVAPVGGFSADCIRAVPDDQDSTDTLSESELAAIRADRSNFYVNVHTASFPAGAIRGQLF
jgi:hypothetical protein